MQLDLYPCLRYVSFSVSSDDYYEGFSEAEDRDGRKERFKQALMTLILWGLRALTVHLRRFELIEGSYKVNWTWQVFKLTLLHS